MQTRRDAMRRAAERRQADLITRRVGGRTPIGSTPSELGRSIGRLDRTDTSRRGDVTIRFGGPTVGDTTGVGASISGRGVTTGAVTSSTASRDARRSRPPIVLYTPPGSSPDGRAPRTALPFRPSDPASPTEPARPGPARRTGGGVTDINPSITTGLDAAPANPVRPGVARRTGGGVTDIKPFITTGLDAAPANPTRRGGARTTPSVGDRNDTGRRGLPTTPGRRTSGANVPGAVPGGLVSGSLGGPGSSNDFPGPPPGTDPDYGHDGDYFPSEYCTTYQVPCVCYPVYTRPFSSFGGWNSGWNAWSSTVCCTGGYGHLSCYRDFGSGLSYSRIRRPFRTWYAPSWNSYGLAYDLCSVDYGYPSYGLGRGYQRPAYNAWWLNDTAQETDYYAWWLDGTAADPTAYVDPGDRGTATLVLPEAPPAQLEPASVKAGWTALEQDDLQRAIDVFGELVLTDEANAGARIGMAIAGTIQGNDEIAITMMRQAMRLDAGALDRVPRSPALDVNFEAVASHYGGRIKVDLDDVDALFMIAATRHLLGDQAVAFFAVDSAMRNGDADESSANLRTMLREALTNTLGR